MAILTKIDSNTTGLRIAEELSIKVLPGTPIWEPFEPNSYADFGAEVQTVARAPINADRQRKKGVKTDIDALAGFNTDITQTNMQSILQGFFFADLRPKGEEVPTAITGTTDLFTVAATAGFFVGSLVFAAGNVEAGNNGLHVVTAIVTDTSVEVLGSTLVTETPSATSTLVVVGFQFDAGDLDVVQAAGGNFPTYTATTKDLTELGLVPGEFIFVGGDSASLAFANVDGDSNEVNNGRKRIRSIVAGSLEVDKAEFQHTTEASTTETVQIFFGRVLKNETGTLIKRRTYQLERTLGAPDDSLPAQVQAQYEVGSLPNEFTLNFKTATKLDVDLAFIALSEDRVDGPTSLKSGTRPTLVDSDAFNTSSDVKRVNLSVQTAGDEDPTPLFAFVEEFTITINNQAQALKAIGVTGGFEVSIGDFEVGGDLTAYFADTAAVDSVNNVDDVSLDVHLYRNQSGIAIDMPLLTLGDGRPTVEKDEPIKIPLSQEAADASVIDAGLNHTLMIVFYDYLPVKADD